MPRKHVNRFARFLKTTAIGGILFLLPLIVIGALIGQTVPVVMAITNALGERIPVDTPGGIATLILLSLLLILFLCFGAGLVARRSWGKKVSMWFEKNLVLLFPRYTVIREQMAGTLGGDVDRPRLIPVLTQFDDVRRLGFEIERGAGGLVTVYLPGSPDPWTGSVVFLEPERVQPLGLEFSDMVSTLEKLGRDSHELIHKQTTT